VIDLRIFCYDFFFQIFFNFFFEGGCKVHSSMAQKSHNWLELFFLRFFKKKIDFFEGGHKIC